MKYTYIGLPTPFKGKTLWEIVGNLKNFGVGRLVLKDDWLQYPETSFLKILRVLPTIPDKRVGYDRKVHVWAEAVYRGRQLDGPEYLDELSARAIYHLVPKSEEHKYLNYEKKNIEIVFPKYQSWPPVYKELWERRNKKATGKDIKIPPLHTIVEQDRYVPRRISDEEVMEKPISTHLFLSKVPVEDLYRELHLLEKSSEKLTTDESKT